MLYQFQHRLFQHDHISLSQLPLILPIFSPPQVAFPIIYFCRLHHFNHHTDRYRINFLCRIFTPTQLGHGLPFDRHQYSTTTFLITGPRLRHFELSCDFEFLGGG
jgi:hypothetical protein